MKPQEAKSRLQRQVEEAKARREQAKQQDDCEHQWQKVEEGLPIDNINFKKSDARFIFLVCQVCERKQLIDYRME